MELLRLIAALATVIFMLMLPLILGVWLINKVSDISDIKSKRKLQKNLALLAGSEFNPNINYVRNGLCVAVDPNRRKFAIGTRDHLVVLTKNDLVEINIMENSKGVFDSYLRLQVSVRDSIRAYYEFGARPGRDQVLREIYAQLKSMKTDDAEPRHPSSETDL